MAQSPPVRRSGGFVKRSNALMPKRGSQAFIRRPACHAALLSALRQIKNEVYLHRNTNCPPTPSGGGHTKMNLQELWDLCPKSDRQDRGGSCAEVRNRLVIDQSFQTAMPTRPQSY